jgi:hypothetical protein
MLIGEIISRVRISNKFDNADSRLTDKYIYNIIETFRDTFLKNEDDKKALIKNSGIFSTLNKVRLVDVDTIEACGMESDCLIKRTQYKLPRVLEAVWGPIIRGVTSTDGYTRIHETTELSYNRKLNLNNPYDKDAYWFYKNGYLYLPNIKWDYIKVDAMFEDKTVIDALNECHISGCIDDTCSGDPAKVNVCIAIQDREFICPRHLRTVIVASVEQELMQTVRRLTEDSNINKNPNN